ncbi:alpha/beta fold hydrolase [Marinomonas ostreistagni]|nr:alpha/beta hydrolase [Marinomonas ostreistagni]
MTEVYCLPGTMCDGRLWQFIKPFLPQNIKLHDVELPIEGDLDELVDSLIARLPKEASHYIGFSLGGYLLTEIARKRPDMLKSAVLISNVGTKLPEAEKIQRQQALEWVLKAGYRGIPSKKARQMLSPEHQSCSELIQIISEMDKALGQEAFVAQLQATLDRRDNLDSIQSSRVEWLVLAGLSDQFLSPGRLKELSNLTNVQVNVVAQSGHMLPLEQPSWLASKLSKFYGHSAQNKS